MSDETQNGTFPFLLNYLGILAGQSHLSVLDLQVNLEDLVSLELLWVQDFLGNLVDLVLPTRHVDLIK